jgi:hypothetical protein
MKTLFSTDFVIYDKEKDKPIRWAIKDDIIIFGDKSEAEKDARGNEIVISCTDLPQHWQDILIKQINKNQNGKRHERVRNLLEQKGKASLIR